MTETAEAPVVAIPSAITPVETKKTKSRVVNMECAFEAFKVISQNGDLDYITKLGKLLSNVSDIMGK